MASALSVKSRPMPKSAGRGRGPAPSSWRSVLVSIHPRSHVAQGTQGFWVKARNPGGARPPGARLVKPFKYAEAEMRPVDPRWVGVALPVLTGIILLAVGILVARRPLAGEPRRALRMFQVWWLCAAAIMFILGAPTVLWLAGVRDVRAYAAVSYLFALPVALGLFGLVYYLVYLYTGSSRALVPLAILYALFFLFELYYFSQSGGRRLETTDFAVRAAATTSPEPWLRIVFGLAVAGPVLGAVTAYALLWRQTRERGPRYRIALVSTAFALWFTPVLVGFTLGLQGAAWFPLVYEVPGLLAAGLILLAYRPPRAIARRLRER